MGKIKIAVIADLHFSYNKVEIAQRIGHRADAFLEQVIQRLNCSIKPDIVLLAGDLLDNSFKSKFLYKKLKKILESLEAPFIAIPGNHDTEQDFYDEFGKLPDYIDINGFRIIPFDDPGLPGFHAVRNAEDLTRLQKNASEFDGPVISLQHVPLIKAAQNPCREHFTNADEIIAMIRNINGGITISGHAHSGVEGTINNDNVHSIVVPAFCESPFRYMIINADTNLNIKTRIEQLDNY